MRKIIISGGTGFIGSMLSKRLAELGNEVVVLTRNQRGQNQINHVRYLPWDGKTIGVWSKELETTTAVINLAGENIGSGLWTQSKKTGILESRLEAGKALVDAIRVCKNKPMHFIQASAIGIYGVSETLQFDETSPHGNDYLAGIGVKWEASTAALEEMGVKRAIIRTGVVLDLKEGAFPKMLLPFKLFVGGRLGSGRQWFSWIHLKDEVEAIIHIVENQLEGVFNLTAPFPVTNNLATKIISQVFQRPSWFPIPDFGLRIILGEMSTLVLDGQNVLPKKLLQTGYKFHFTELHNALADIKSNG